MMTLLSEEIERYASSHSTPEDPLLRELTEVTHRKTDLPQMLIGHIEGQFLKMLCRMTGAARVLEIGTFTGYSALSMAAALPEDGELITCDIDAETTKIAQEFWGRSPHGAKIKLLLGNAIETIPKLKGLFDFVFIDADKENYVNYWELGLPLLRCGGIFVIDNVLWSGRVLDPQAETDKAIAAFNKKIQKDLRTEIVMLTVRDGMTIARKK